MNTAWSPTRERTRRDRLLARAVRAHPRHPAWFVCRDEALGQFLQASLAARGGGFARFGTFEEFCLALEARLGLPFAHSASTQECARVLESHLAARGFELSGHGNAGPYRTALALLPVIERLRAHQWDGRSFPNDRPVLPPDAACLVVSHVELLGDLVAELDAWLLAHGALDRVARLRRCTQALHRIPLPCPFLVALEGFWRLAPVERDLLTALLPHGAELDVAPWVVGGPALPPPEHPFPLDALPARANGLLEAIDRGASSCAHDDGSVQLVTAADPEEEARLTAAWIAERCARGSVPNAYAVWVVDPSHGGLDRVRRALAAHGVPTHGAATVATRDTVPWQVFCACIRLGWSGVDVFDLATVLSAPGSGVWGRHRDRLVAMLRRTVPGDWHGVRHLLDAFVDTARDGSDHEPSAPDDGRAGARRRVDELVDLWSWYGPLRRLLPGERAASLVLLVRETLDRFFNPVRHVDALDDPRTQVLWVAAVAQVAEAARQALQRTVDTGSPLPETPDAWLAEVEALLGEVTDGTDPPRGDGVALLTTPWPLGIRPRSLFVHGFTRERVPPPLPPSILLGPFERAWLASLGADLASIPDEASALDEARLTLRRGLAMATERVILVAPRHAVDGTDCLPSLAWNDLRAVLPPSQREHVPVAFDRWVANDLGDDLRAPRLRRDLAFAALGNGQVHDAVAGCAPLAKHSIAVRDMARSRFAPLLDFDLGARVAPTLEGRVYTPQALETLLVCRYAFLGEVLLGLGSLRLARRPSLGAAERLRVATAAIGHLGALGTIDRAVDRALKTEVPWAFGHGHELALAELRRTVEHFLARYTMVQRALALGDPLPAPQELSSVTLTLPSGRTLTVAHGTHILHRSAVVELTARSPRHLPVLRDAGLDVSAALAAQPPAAAVLRLSLTRAEGDLVAGPAPRREDAAPPAALSLSRSYTLEAHRARVLAALAHELDALRAPDARYAPHDEARAQTLERLGALACPRCAMRLACRFRLGASP